jgi:hypothetical protein
MKGTSQCGRSCSLKKFKHHQFWAFETKIRVKELPVLGYLEKMQNRRTTSSGYLEKNENQRTASPRYLKQKSEAKNHQFWVLEKTPGSKDPLSNFFRLPVPQLTVLSFDSSKLYQTCQFWVEAPLVLDFRFS